MLWWLLGEQSIPSVLSIGDPLGPCGVIQHVTRNWNESYKRVLLQETAKYSPAVDPVAMVSKSPILYFIRTNQALEVHLGIGLGIFG